MKSTNRTRHILVISQDLDGRSAVINQGATSTAGNPYDKLLVDGVAVAG